MIRLDIFSDPICPWCYIGKSHLDRALEANPGHPFQIEWHPFQLNPEMPEAGMDRTEYLEHKFGGREGALRAYAPVVEHAEAAGLTIDLAAIERTPNTLDAHRLIHWAGLEGRQTSMVATLFRAYFREGRDIGDRQVLSELAGEAGLDRAMTARLLEGDGDREEIRQRDAHARSRGIGAVPTFIIGNRHAVEGAQRPELWGRVIQELLDQIRDAADEQKSERRGGKSTGHG